MIDPSRNILRTAPITSITTVESLVGAVLTFLATHHVLGDIDVSATTQTVAPFVALALPAVFGAAKWRLVTPAIKVVELAERDGLVTDADLARIGAIIDDKLTDRGLVADDAQEPVAADPVLQDDSDSDSDSDSDGMDEHRPEHEAALSSPGGMAGGC